MGNNVLGLQVPDGDARVGTSAQPVTVGGEAQSVDSVSSLKRVQVLTLVQVPEHGSSVLATRSAERSVGRNGNSVDVTSVANQVVLQLAVGQVPNLDNLVATTGNDDGVGLVGGEADAGNPVSVSIVDGVLALTEGVPELDGLITSTGNDLTVVSGEGNGEDILGVADEAASGGAVVQVPEAQSGVPGSGQGELTIGGDDGVLDKVVVSTESAASKAVLKLLTGQAPDNDGLV